MASKPKHTQRTWQLRGKSISGEKRNIYDANRNMIGLVTRRECNIEWHAHYQVRLRASLLLFSAIASQKKRSGRKWWASSREKKNSLLPRSQTVRSFWSASCETPLSCKMPAASSHERERESCTVLFCPTDKGRKERDGSKIERNQRIDQIKELHSGFEINVFFFKASLEDTLWPWSRIYFPFISKVRDETAKENRKRSVLLLCLLEEVNFICKIYKRRNKVSLCGGPGQFCQKKLHNPGFFFYGYSAWWSHSCDYLLALPMRPQNETD